MIFDKILGALHFNLKKASEIGDPVEAKTYIDSAKSIFEMALKDIENNPSGGMNQSIQTIDTTASTPTPLGGYGFSNNLNESKLDKAINNYKRLF